MSSIDEEMLNKQGHTVLISKTSEFSNTEKLHFPEAHSKTEYSVNDEAMAEMYWPKVYVNGMSKESEGFIDFKFSRLPGMKRFEGTCLISVIDKFENLRFIRSFEFSCMPATFTRSAYMNICIEKYISRQTLLSERDDLLPKDVLTLQIEIFVSSETSSLNYYKVLSDQKTSFDVNSEGDVNLLLDSRHGKRLREESRFFQVMVNSPMLESTTRRMKISKADVPAYKRIAEILMDINPLIFLSISDVVFTYILADKYDISIVRETCECFIKLAIFNHRANRSLYGTFEVNSESFQICFSEHLFEKRDVLKQGYPLKQRVGNYEWILKQNDQKGLEHFLWFEKQAVSAEKSEETEFDFYK